MSLEDDALIRPSIMGPLTLDLCKLAPIVFILLEPSISGFLQKHSRLFNAVLPEDQDTDSSQKKRKKSSFCTLCYYCTFCRVYTKLDFKEDIGLAILFS